MNQIQEEVKIWLLEAIDKTASDGIAHDSHIDLYGIYTHTNKQKAFEQACLIINSVASILTHVFTNDLGIYLHVDLISDKSIWSGI